MGAVDPAGLKWPPGDVSRSPGVAHTDPPGQTISVVEPSTQSDPGLHTRWMVEFGHANPCAHNTGAEDPVPQK